RLDDGGEPRASGPQDRARGRQCAAPDRHPGRRAVHDRHPHAQLRLRRQELELRGTAQHTRPILLRRLGALPEREGDAAARTHPPRRRTLPPPSPTLPAARSLSLGYTYTRAKLAEPMPARRADPRVGHFETEVWNFSNDAKFTARTHYVNRWRLEKKDPDAAL